MKTVVEDLGGSQKKLVFDIPPEDVDQEIEKYCKKLAKEVDVRGFRKGKAPPSVIKRYFKQQIHGDVASQLVSSSFEPWTPGSVRQPLNSMAIAMNATNPDR